MRDRIERNGGMTVRQLVLAAMILAAVAAGAYVMSDMQRTVIDTTSGDGTVDFSDTVDRGFRIDNVYHSPVGDIHFHSYIPEDEERYSALFVTLPGWEGLYFQGVGSNLRYEDFAFVALDYSDDMIVLAPQLNDWGTISADQTIALVEYFLGNYDIDGEKVLLEGFSGGGETGSIAVSKRPDLFSRFLFVSSRWDGAFDTIAEARTPIYIFIGENDDYYGSAPAKKAYRTLWDMYSEQGLTGAEIDELIILDVRGDSFFQQKGVDSPHGGGALASHEHSIMEWLFGKKEV